MPRSILIAACAAALVAAAMMVTSARGDDHPKFELDGNRLKLPGALSFEAGSDKLAAGSENDAILDHVKAYLEAKSSISTLRIEGHVDASAGVEDALGLTKLGALAVARALVAKGVDCKRLLPVGFGSTKPVADGSTPEGKAANTRIECVNAALRGHAIGGAPLDGGGSAAGDPCQ